MLTEPLYNLTILMVKQVQKQTKILKLQKNFTAAFFCNTVSNLFLKKLFGSLAIFL